MCEEESDFEYVISYRLPIARSDLDSIQQVLREADPFIPGVAFEDPYDVVEYLPRPMLQREEYVLLVDRNVATRWVGTASGHRPTAAHRQAAAIMPFAHAADFLIEPNIALYELAAHVSAADALHELSVFYSSVAAPTTAWADVALGRRASVVIATAAKADAEKPKPDLKRPLYRWRRNYILALKLAELHLKGGKPLALMTELMRWMYHDFLIGGPALQLASFYLAPGAPRRRLMKGIESPDRERALAGIRNAAWDLTLVSEWLRNVAPRRNATSPPVCILCTLDHNVRRLARSAVSYDDTPMPGEEAIFRMLEPLWGERAARDLSALLHGYQQNADDTNRALHKQQPDDFIDAMTADREFMVRSWSPPVTDA